MLTDTPARRAKCPHCTLASVVSQQHVLRPRVFAALTGGLSVRRQTVWGVKQLPCLALPAASLGS